ncbi:MAG: diguanylate cyclase, partial [Actinobacteria bacterium]
IGVALAYPVADILLLAMLVRLFLSPGRPSTAGALLVAALGAWLVGDFVYAFLALDGSYHVGQLVDATWLVGAACFGAAALHPSMREVAAPAKTAEIRFSTVRFAVLAGASLMAPAVLVIQWLTGGPIDVPVIAAGSVIMFLLVIGRLAALVSDLRNTIRQRHALEDELERRSLTDPLTGLANRVLFHDRLAHVLAQRTGKAAVLFLDVDDFKTVNDTAGHQAGDGVLRWVAEAIRRTLRPGDTAARLGGDEFAILLEDGPDAYAAGQVAERLLSAIQAPTAVASRDYSIGASIGISLGSGATSDAETLMREADIAMYVAKGQGKGQFTVFEPSTHAPVLRSLELRADLEQAIRDHQFELFYQPIVDLATGAMAGVEALVRWRHPTRGLLEPSDFIPLAEATGAIVPMGRWILEEACREAARWWGRRTSHAADITADASAPGGSAIGSATGSPAGSAIGAATGSPTGVATGSPTGAKLLRARRGSACVDRSSRAAAGPRDDRERAAGPGERRRLTADASRHGRPAGDRRLRDGVRVAEPAAPNPVRHPQDRPELRRRPDRCRCCRSECVERRTPRASRVAAHGHRRHGQTPERRERRGGHRVR